MRVAVFHNFMDNIGGAEKVGLTLGRELKADLYTTNIDEDKIVKMGFNDVNLISIARVPINAPFRQQTAFYKFKKLKLENKYDFYIIDGDWAMSGAINNKPNLWYVHSPIREIWDSYEYTRNNIVPWYYRNLFDIWVKYNRYLNLKYLKHVQGIACNSQNTKKRIKNFLKREAKVIYPPVDTKKLYYRPAQNYWLSVNRLFAHKRIEIQMQAFSKLPSENLIIVGPYEKARHFKKYVEFIKSIKPKNVEIKHWVSFDELRHLYANCKGLIATARDEDFGLTPVEAMASGKPVIATNEGGYKETIINDLTGKLIEDIDAEKLARAVDEIGKNLEKYPSVCQQQAEKFDTKVFVQKVKDMINDALSKLS